MKQFDDLSRHDLVWLDPRRWQTGLRCEVSREAMPLAEEWVGRCLPAVVGRQREDDPSAVLSLGIPLTPDNGRMRLSLKVCRTVVVGTRRPMSLQEVLPTAPVHWQEPLRRIMMSVAEVGLMPQVYGSLAWQHLTGTTYLSAGSDADLLFPVHTRGQLDHVLDTLRDVEKNHCPRIDGEVLFATGDAVAWRELLQAPGKVMVKSYRSLSLRSVADLLQALPMKGDTDGSIQVLQ